MHFGREGSLIGFVESFFPKLVVLPPHLIVLQDFVGAINAHELFARLWIILQRRKTTVDILRKDRKTGSAMTITVEKDNLEFKKSNHVCQIWLGHFFF